MKNEVLRHFAIERGWIKASETDFDAVKLAVAGARAEGEIDEATFKSLLKGHRPMTKTATPTAAQVFGGGGSRIDVLPTSGKFSTEKRAGIHAKWGRQIENPFTGGPAETQSQADAAKAGALFKHLANRAGLGVTLADYERDLLGELSEEVWAGRMDGEQYDRIAYPERVKALLDDVTSGGIEIAPISFDNDIVTFPLLTGELFPRVDLKTVARGRRIEGGSINTPTLTWGGADATEIALFTTTSLVSAIDTSIHVVNLAIEIGRDFLSDAAVDVGSILTALIGERLSAELDKVIADGNGSTQPEGLLQASGTGAVNTDNDTTGPPTLNDYVKLMFAIGKQYRNAGMRCAFLSNDTTYQRSRTIRVDPQSSTTDQRPVLTGGDTTSFNNYMSLGWPHAIQNDIGNSVAAFVALAKYRMYRRMGLELRFEQGGKELARKNLVLLIARARFGGQLVDADACAKWEDGQS